MYTLLKPLIVREELLKRNLRVFTPEEFTRIFHTNLYSTKYFLTTQVENGLFLRLKRGLYVLKTDLPCEEEIANKIYMPSYISFEYALAYYNNLPEMPYEVTSATTKSTRLFTTQNRSYAYYSIKKEAYTGYTLVEKDSKRFLIADPEKTVVDYFYYVTLGKRILNDRFSMDGLDKKKALHYAALYERDSLVKFIESRL